MEWLNQIWVWVLGGLGGITVGGIVTVICTAFIKGSITKVVAKVDVAKTEEKAVNEGLKKLKGVTFKHNIQPVVESEIAKLNETAIAGIKGSLNDIKAEYTNLVLIMKKLAAYFDDSIVSDEKKAELHEAIAQAEGSPLYVESVALEENIKEDKKAEIVIEQATTTNTTKSVER